MQKHWAEKLKFHVQISNGFRNCENESSSRDEVLVGDGVLEVLPDGFGFLRSPQYNYLPLRKIFMSPLLKFAALI